MVERGEAMGCSTEVDSRRTALSCTHDAIRACLLRRREELEVVARRERGRRTWRRRVELIVIVGSIPGKQNREKGERTVERCMGQWERNVLVWAKIVRKEVALHGT